MKNFKTKLFAAAMAAPLAMSGVTAVFADEATDAQKGTAAPVVKTTVSLAGDINPESLSFTYRATRSNEDGNETTFTYPAVEPKTLTYTASAEGMTVSDVDENNMKTLTATTNLFDGVNYTHAGVYVWNVQQSSTCAQNTDTIKRTLTPAPEAYTVKAYVYNRNEGTGFEVTYVVENATGKKVETTEGKHILAFTNNYSEVRENQENGVFSLTHKVDGELADKTRDFTYTVSFAKPSNAESEEISVEGLTANDNGTYTYTAKHGDPAFKVTKAPVGTVVTITPTNVPDDYTTNWEGATADSNGVVKAAITADGTYLTVTHTKDATTSPITGNIINNLPFLGLIAVALGGFIAYIALKRRQNA